MATLTLLVRNAFIPHLAEHDRRYPAIESFFSRCGALTHSQISLAGWICRAFGVEQQSDWPVGAILAQSHDTQANETPESDAYWICADPVHLVVDRDSLILQPQSQLRLSESESLDLCSTLTAHFGTADLHMMHVDTGRWCVGTSRHPDLVTTDIELAEGRNVNDVLPSGEDASTWQRYVTEAQMILHDHPVNTVREAHGEPVVNSLWLWGGGNIPETKQCFDQMSGSAPLLRALGKLSEMRMTEPPGMATDFYDSGDTFAELLPRPASGDPAFDETVLANLESALMVPAWHALRDGSLDKLTLVLQLPGAVVECSCDRQARRCFWKRRWPLSRTLAKLQEAR